ncbi:MAG: hypothetical protein ACKO0M_05325 [Cyanobium sp.]
MTTANAPHVNLRLNFNDRDYTFQELPQTAQQLLKDIAGLDQQIGQLQFDLRHLQAAREVFSTALRTTMVNQTQGSDDSDGNGFHPEHQDWDSGSQD